MIKVEPKPEAKPAAPKKTRKTKGKRRTARKTARKPAAPKAKVAAQQQPSAQSTTEAERKAASPEAVSAPKLKPKTEPKPGSEHKGGTPPKLTDVGKVIEILRALGGIKAAAAQQLNVSRTTLYKFIDEHPEVVEALVEIDSEIGDVAEAQVVKAINAGDMQTVRWYLETKGKDRGYARRVENTGKGGGPMEVREKADLSKLSDEELEILARAAAQRESEAGAR